MRKPDVIFKLEQESAPWIVETSVYQELPGRSAHSGQGSWYYSQYLLTGILSDFCCKKILSKEQQMRHRHSTISMCRFIPAMPFKICQHVTLSIELYIGLFHDGKHLSHHLPPSKIHFQEVVFEAEQPIQDKPALVKDARCPGFSLHFCATFSVILSSKLKYTIPNN